MPRLQIFHSTIAQQKAPLLKISDDVIARNLLFAPPPQSKILATPMLNTLLRGCTMRIQIPPKLTPTIPNYNFSNTVKLEYKT